MRSGKNSERTGFDTVELLFLDAVECKAEKIVIVGEEKPRIKILKEILKAKNVHTSISQVGGRKYGIAANRKAFSYGMKPSAINHDGEVIYAGDLVIYSSSPDPYSRNRIEGLNSSDFENLLHHLEYRQEDERSDSPEEMLQLLVLDCRDEYIGSAACHEAS